MTFVICSSFKVLNVTVSNTWYKKVAPKAFCTDFVPPEVIKNKYFPSALSESTDSFTKPV